jgi:hypothetical protein
MMIKLSHLLALGIVVSAGDVLAADSSCSTNAADMKLAGAAKNSFMQKCERDNGCETKAAEKKLAGAAKNSFVKKCVKDAKAASK